MTSAVISVSPDASIRDIAKLLLGKGISAVPVVDGDGVPLGIVSEGDLLGRDETEREARKDWWLALLVEGETLHADFLASMRAPDKQARDVMSAPLITIGEGTGAVEIARLLATHRVKRVPVVRDGRIVGIVSRADLLRALVAEPQRPAGQQDRGLLSGIFASLDDRFLHRQHSVEPPSALPPGAPSDQSVPKVADFQGLVSDFKHHEQDEREAQRKAFAERRKEQVVELIDDHISDEKWRTLIHDAREAAEHGQKQMLLLRFPNELCSDGGRAINVTEPEWPSTLRGEAAEMYLRWQRDLKPHGFHLSASVLDFPGGKPGDIGLFLVWGE